MASCFHDDAVASMHIPDGVLSPAVCLATGAVSIGAVGYSLRQLNQAASTRTVPLTSMLAAFLFAGQMVNLPLPGLPISGHLLGGVIAGVILGPWAGCVALTLVLVVQCLLFADGGLLVLGANILHISVVGCLGSYAVYSLIRNRFQNPERGVLWGSVVAAWLSVMAAAFLFCVEFAVSHAGSEYNLRRVFGLMIVLHAVIGIGEAVISGLLIRFVQQQKPELIFSPQNSSPVAGLTRVITAGLLAALAVAAFLAPLASSYPDGLEAVASRTGFDAIEQDNPQLVLTDYEIPFLSRHGWTRVSVGLAGIGGTLVVLLFGFLLNFMTRAAPDPAPSGSSVVENV